MNPYLRTLLAILSLFALPSIGSSEEFSVDILSGQIRSVPISLSLAHSPDDPQNQNMRVQIEGLIGRNLAWSGIFVLDDERAFPENRQNIVIQPNFDRWQTIKTQILVTGNVSVLPPDNQGTAYVDVSVRLWNVVTRELLLNKGYRTQIGNWRRLSHIISDDIFERVTGERGYFDSRIVYVAETGPPNKRTRRLAIMDQDGEHLSYLTENHYQALSPRFSPDRQRIAYTRIEHNSVHAYILELASGLHSKIPTPSNMSFAQRFGHNDNYLFLTLTENDNSDIYRFDINTKKLSRLTFNPAIDVSASASPEGNLIAFTSDRSGNPQIYTMQKDGSQQKRISFGNGFYSTPVWSPRGDLIAFTKQTQGQFYIGVMTPEGANERLLTSAFLVESPAWAPNGQRLIFYQQRNPQNDQLELYSIDILGLHGRIIPTPTLATDPSWSPHLPR
jgi:TolB protein